MIIFLGDKPDIISGYTQNFLYNVPIGLSNLGIEVMYYPRYSKDNLTWVDDLVSLSVETDATAIIALGVRYFTMESDCPLDVLKDLRSKYKGLLYQQVDVPQVFEANIEYQVLNLCVDNQGLSNPEYEKYNRYIGWAYTENINGKPCFTYDPNTVKNDGVIRVFVDHSTFSYRSLDYSLTVYLSLIELSKSKKIEVRTLTDDGIQKVDLNNVNIRVFNRKHLPVEQFAEQLRWADLFMATHSESLGLTLLEAASCGALPLVLENTIPQGRLETIDHYSYRHIKWEDVLIDKHRVHLSAKDNSWENLCLRIKEIILQDLDNENSNCTTT